jgi:hypothetical protein
MNKLNIIASVSGGILLGIGVTLAPDVMSALSSGIITLAMMFLWSRASKDWRSDRP